MSKPTAQEVRDLLEGYGITASVLSDKWIEDCRDEEIIPHVNEITRMDFETEQEVTEYYNGNGQNALILNRRPVNEIVSITYVDELVINNLIDSIVLIGAEGIVKARSGYPGSRYDPVFRRGTKNIKVVYKYGYTNYPIDVKRAIKLMVAIQVLNLIGSRTGGGSVSVQSHSRNYGRKGKYTDVMEKMAASAYTLLQKYITVVTGG